MSPENIILRPLNRLERWDRNYRVGDVPAIVASIVRFGFNGALRVWNDRVMAGNHSLLALQTMHANGATAPRGVVVAAGEWLIPCVDVSHLSETEAAAFAIADNRTQELGQVDDERLALLLEQIKRSTGSLEGTGYSDESLSRLLDSIRMEESKRISDPMPEDPDNPNFGEVRPERGQVWRLGRHRLMCGDGRDKIDIEKLMAGATADMVFTDPPYGVGYTGKTKQALKIQNDNLGDEGTRKLVAELLRATPIKKGGAFYICSPAGATETAFRLAIADAGLDLKQCIVWAKDRFVLGRQDYHWRHESILYGWRPGAAHFFAEDRTKDTVWEYDRPSVNGDHPTIKPLDLVEEAIANSSQEGDIVYDCCVGSGTTIIACERLSRRCYALEIDPRYAEVSMRRWEQATGQSAALEQHGDHAA